MPDTLQIKTRGSSSMDVMTQLMNIAFQRALARESAISPEALQIPGMSGKLYRMFINNLVRLLIQPSYLEVGSWAGSTACAALDKNVVNVTCIDNWSQFGGPRETFFDNIQRFKNTEVYFRFVEGDFREVDFTSLGTNNIYLYDGPHGEKDQYDGLSLYKTALADEFFFIVDDWNGPGVRAGTLNAIRDVGYRIDYSIEIRTRFDEHHPDVHSQDSDWHNGYFLSKLSRSGS